MTWWHSSHGCGHCVHGSGCDCALKRRGMQRVHQTEISSDPNQIQHHFTTWLGDCTCISHMQWCCLLSVIWVYVNVSAQDDQFDVQAPGSLSDIWLVRLVPRPRPAFCRLQYRKAVRTWYLLSLWAWDNQQNGKKILRKVSRIVQPTTSSMLGAYSKWYPASYICVVSCLVP